MERTSERASKREKGEKPKSTMYVHRAQNGINRKTRKTKSPNHGNQFREREREIHGIEKRMNKKRELRTVENQGERGRLRQREWNMSKKGREKFMNKYRKEVRCNKTVVKTSKRNAK